MQRAAVTRLLALEPLLGGQHGAQPRDARARGAPHRLQRRQQRPHGGGGRGPAGARSRSAVDQQRLEGVEDGVLHAALGVAHKWQDGAHPGAADGGVGGEEAQQGREGGQRRAAHAHLFAVKLNKHVGWLLLVHSRSLPDLAYLRSRCLRERRFDTGYSLWQPTSKATPLKLADCNPASAAAAFMMMRLLMQVPTSHHQQANVAEE